MTLTLDRPDKPEPTIENVVIPQNFINSVANSCSPGEADGCSAKVRWSMEFTQWEAVDQTAARILTCAKENSGVRVKFVEV
jgi:hypothetical protein